MDEALLFTLMRIGFPLGAGLVGLALLALLRSRLRSRQRLRRPPVLPAGRRLVHSINDDRCTGCDACVLVCPTDVLELQTNKSRVLRFEDCIQCEQCVHVCVTSAIAMHYPDAEPPQVLMADLDTYYQSVHRGLYLIGEAAGKPLVKNALNLGRAVIEHALREGLQHHGRAGAPGSAPLDGERVDVVIIGSGPAGLSAALTCLLRGLSHVVLEQEALVAPTIARYPKGKRIVAEPQGVRCLGLLPIWDAAKDDAIAEWNRILAEVDLDVRLQEVVQDVRREGGGYMVRTARRTFSGQRVVVAVGTHGKPRRLGIAGEDLPHVRPLLDDPDQHQGQTLLVVGGGDSAVEAAITLSSGPRQNRVILSYRGRQFSRVNGQNRRDLDLAVQERRVIMALGSHVQRFGPRQAALRFSDGTETVVEADHAYVLIGADPPVQWLESLGISHVARPHSFTRAATDQLVEGLVGRQPENDRPNLPLRLTRHAGEGRAHPRTSILVPEDRLLRDGSQLLDDCRKVKRLTRSLKDRA